MGYAAFKGTYTALVTPFLDDTARSIDHKAFEAFVEAQLAGGVEGIVPCGTTGESPTLDYAEQLALVKTCVSLAKGRAQVIAGTGSNSTKAAIDLSVAAEKAGVDGVMVVVPYYNKPTQEGLFQHFVAVAKAVSCPVIVYNIPGRSGIDLAADTLARICDAAPNVTATKEATGNVLRAQELSRRMGDRLTILSGDDGLTLAMASVGAKGVISVTSNVLPKEVSDTTRLVLAGKWDEARRAHFALLPVHEAMFVEANPGPAKAVLASKTLMSDIVRLPLAPISEGARTQVLAAMARFERGEGK